MLQNIPPGRRITPQFFINTGNILFAVISRHELITLSVPPTFQGSLRKQRILQQSSPNIICSVAYHHLYLFYRLHKLKKTKKNIICLTLSTNRQLFYSLARISYTTGVH